VDFLGTSQPKGHKSVTLTPAPCNKRKFQGPKVKVGTLATAKDLALTRSFIEDFDLDGAVSAVYLSLTRNLKSYFVTIGQRKIAPYDEVIVFLESDDSRANINPRS